MELAAAEDAEDIAGRRLYKLMEADLTTEDKKGFWARQFSREITPKQKMFDVVFGIVIPILCLIFDPGIFRDGLLVGVGYLSSIKIFSYVSIGLGIGTLSIWLSSRMKSSLLVGFISGILFTGTLLALALGIFLLPLSIIGLLIIIGIFGFTPFPTAFVFLRNGIRAIQTIQANTNKVLLIGTILLGIFCVIVIPFIINWKTTEPWAPNELWLPIERLWLPISTPESGVIHFVIDNQTNQKTEPFLIEDANKSASVIINQIEPFTIMDVYFENSLWGENGIAMIDSNGRVYGVVGYFESPQSGRVDIRIECVTPEGFSGKIRTLVSSDHTQWRPFGVVNCK